jgi:hypothetical protein
MNPMLDGSCIIAEATPADIFVVVKAMDDAARHEMFACRFDDDLDAFATGYAHSLQMAIKAFAAFPGADQPPAAIFGAWLVSPGVAELHKVSTPAWLTVARPVHRFIRRIVWPYVLVPNVHRAQARLWTGNVTGRRWCRSLGMTEESIERRAGKNGEDFVTCVWLRP